MCTATWLPFPGGYSFWFNRDERRTRAPASGPETLRAGDILAVAPRDGEAGGTWIGANELGVTVALANRYVRPMPPEPPARLSRGVLVRELLDAPGPDEVRRRLETGALAAFPPFTLLVAAPDLPVHRFAWDGAVLAADRVAQAGLVVVSSGGGAVVEAERTRLIDEAAAACVGTGDPACFEALHRSHRPEAGPLSVCMHHELAGSVSLTRVDVTAGEVTLTYTPGPPGETPAGPAITLRRRATLPAGG